MKERDYDKQKWKLVTLFIGGNDLCRYCNNPVRGGCWCEKACDDW